MRQNSSRVQDGRPSTPRHSGQTQLITTWVPKRNEPWFFHPHRKDSGAISSSVQRKGLDAALGVLTLGMWLPLQGLGPLHLLVPSSDAQNMERRQQRTIYGGRAAMSEVGNRRSRAASTDGEGDRRGDMGAVSQPICWCTPCSNTSATDWRSPGCTAWSSLDVVTERRRTRQSEQEGVVRVWLLLEAVCRYCYEHA